MDSAENTYTIRLNGVQVSCDGGFEQACQMAQRMMSCLASAQSLAWKNLSVGGIPAQVPTDYGSIAGTVGTWYSASRDALNGTLQLLQSFAVNILHFVDLFSELARAYAACGSA